MLKMESKKNRIGKNIKHLRESKNFSKILIASKIRKTQTTIRSYETGKILPPVNVLRELAKLFEVSVSDLIERDLTQVAPHGVVEEPAPNYGRQRQLEREKALLHGSLDDKERALQEISARIGEIEDELRSDPEMRSRHAELLKMLATLRKKHK
jgi:transcriptional regulator with XRE-family HTH domain